MLLDRPCHSSQGTQNQHTDGLTRHKHTALHLPPSLACLSSLPCELSAKLCICIQNDEGSETSAWRKLHILHAFFEILPGWASFAKQFDNKSKILCNLKPNSRAAEGGNSRREFKRFASGVLHVSLWHGLFAELAPVQCHNWFGKEWVLYIRGSTGNTGKLAFDQVLQEKGQ